MFKNVFFEDRTEAGKMLAAKLEKFSDGRTMILAIPRGGVVVGYEIAKKIHAPMDIIVPRKLRAPYQPEFAIGAITEDGNIVLDEKTITLLNISSDYIKMESQRQKTEIDRRLRVYKGESKIPDLTGLDVIVVDDGIATGATMKAALISVRKRGAKSIILATPVASLNALRMLEQEADKTISLFTPQHFYAIGQFYRNFEQTSDQEVKELLKKNKTETS
ncbi:MAG: phosphoribosyltransferase [Planctomycetota bacterium]|jgi:predicted phosphoribosyltransferase